MQRKYLNLARISQQRNGGFKDVGLPKDEMIKLAAKMKEAGKETYIEVVTYTEEGCLEGAKLAYECGLII